MKKEEIYDFIIKASTLSEIHQQELINKRGFSQDTIKKNLFFSSGPVFLETEKHLSAAFREEDLVESGVFLHDGRQARINPILLEDRIVIPYLRADGSCYLLRPHKLGLTGIPIEVYHEANLADKPSEIIITEGEFKAVAGMQFGIPTIAVPGISSFSEVHFPRLVKLLNDYGVRKVTIVFDNEVKDDPAFPSRYKENPADRYDTQFYAYYMASRLEREGKDARIGMLPDGWRVDGKIDLDGAAAQVRQAAEIKKIVFDAKTHKEFLKDLEREPQQIVLRKLKQKRFRSHIKKEFGHYVASRKTRNGEYDEVISNFLVRIVATHQTPEGVVREVIFENEFGESSPMFSIFQDQMPSADGFASFCFGCGNFVWRGKKEDLLTIWEMEFLNNDGRYIVEPDHIGWIESEKIWLFGNVAIDREGHEMRPDKNHVFWMEKKGLKPIPLCVTTGKSASAEGVPYLNLSPVDMKEIINRLSDTIGRERALVCLGWISAIPFLEEIFDMYGFFPFLFVTGKRGSGKSTVAEWFMNFFGLENAGKSISETTQVGIHRFLSYYSCLPVYLDEYRNTKLITMKNGFLRNAYNRQSAGKGVKANFGLREAKTRGTLLLCGEDIPDDNALKERCIQIYVSSKARKENHMSWFMANRRKFSGHTLDLLKRKKTLVRPFLEKVVKDRAFLIEQCGNDRIAAHYAIIAAACDVILGERSVDLAKWFLSQAIEANQESESTHALSEFLEGLLYLKQTGKIDETYYGYDPGKREIFLWFKGAYNRIREEFNKIDREAAFSKEAIRKYLVEEESFMGDHQVHRLNGVSKRCMVFGFDKAPETLRDLVGLENVTLM